MIRRAMIASLAFTLAALWTPSGAFAADNVTGTWKWSTEFNGQKRETTLKLKQDGEKLSGTISGRQNTENEIEEAKIDKDGAISFQVTREFNGNKFVMKYTAKLEGGKLKGKRETERNGEKQTQDFEAEKSE